MRAIVDREHKRAADERRQAQEAHAAARPTATTAAWSTKASAADKRRRRPNEIEKQHAIEVEQAKSGWAKRHPQAAAAERALRKERAELLDRWCHKNDGTPETHEHASRRNQGALVRLYQTGAIDADQLASAVEIATVAERIGADVAVRTASLETRVDVTRMGDGTFYEKLAQVRHEVAYTRWRGEVSGPIAAILDMLVGEPVGFTVVAQRYRMHNRRAKRLLLDALDLWPRILGTVRKDVDDATLAAAHAGILG